MTSNKSCHSWHFTELTLFKRYQSKNAYGYNNPTLKIYPNNWLVHLRRDRLDLRKFIYKIRIILRCPIPVPWWWNHFLSLFCFVNCVCFLWEIEMLGKQSWLPARAVGAVEGLYVGRQEGAVSQEKRDGKGLLSKVR